MSGIADELIARLRAAGTRAVFGLPGGGGNLDLIDAARRADLPFILTATETGSAIAAIAQAEITGAPGACITTLGPGAASVVNGVACARLERAPLLVVTDQLAGAAPFEHQRIDQGALLASLATWSGTLAPPNALPTLDEAFTRLAAQPPGPVHLDCPGDAFSGDAGRVPPPGTAPRTEPRVFRPGVPSDDHAADRLPRDVLARAKRPLIIAGLGARQHEVAMAIRALSERLGVPVMTTYKAKGVVPDRDPWFAGVFTHGAIERRVIDRSDLLIGVGFDPVEILPRSWTYAQPIVSIAPWRMATDHVPFASQDVTPSLAAIERLGAELEPTDWDAAWIRSEADAARAAVAGALPASQTSAPTAQDVVLAAARLLAGRARVTVDAGAHMFAAMSLWPAASPNEILISNGLSTMGFALPAAMGAALVDRAPAAAISSVRPVVAFTGDAGLLICAGELATLARERLPVIVVVFNDASLSLIEIKQQQRNLAPAGVALGEIDWKRMAEGFGLAAWSARTRDELDRALEAAADAGGPALIDVRIDRTNYGATMKAIRG
jgi:acetolactate synthase-1/2/3 large subunit